MSIKAMTWAWNVAEVTRAQRLVLLALGDFSNDDGVSWPSIDSIGRKALLQPRRLQMVLRQLEERRLVRVAFGEGKHGTNQYTMLMSESAGVQKMRGALSRPENAPNPSGTSPKKKDTTTTTDRAGEAIGVFFTEWDSNIKQLVTPMVRDQVIAFFEENEAATADWARESIRRAVGAGVPKLNYIMGILRPWATQGRMDNGQSARTNTHRSGAKRDEQPITTFAEIKRRQTEADAELDARGA